VSFRLLAGAKRELMDAAARYEGKRTGLGDEFLDEVVEALRRLEMWRRIRRFPYALIYRPAGDEIVVIAVMHLKRRPRYWLRRAQREDK
jgi:hypothetical protein